MRRSKKFYNKRVVHGRKSASFKCLNGYLVYVKLVISSTVSSCTGDDSQRLSLRTSSVLRRQRRQRALSIAVKMSKIEVYVYVFKRALSDECERSMYFIKTGSVGELWPAFKSVEHEMWRMGFANRMLDIISRSRSSRRNGGGRFYSNDDEDDDLC